METAERARGRAEFSGRETDGALREADSNGINGKDNGECNDNGVESSFRLDIPTDCAPCWAEI
jgi:hypothetical protein